MQEPDKMIEYLPVRVYPFFKTDVFSVRLEDSIGKAIKIMYENSFSQLPIFKDQKFYDLLTNNTISRWLGACADDDLFSLDDTEVSQVLEYTENPDNYFFLNSNAHLSEAMEKFQYFETLGKRLDAILITENGSPVEPLLGIITSSDISKILNQIK